MGYTHYWKFQVVPSPVMWKRFLKHAAAIVKYKADMLAGPDGQGRPVTHDCVAFNGKAPLDDHETCLFPKDSDDLYDHEERCPGFNFCKTACKPYDTVVVACLIALKCDLGALVEVSSDGDIPKDWEEGKRLFEQVSGLKCELSAEDNGNLRVSPKEESKS